MSVGKLLEKVYDLVHDPQLIGTMERYDQRHGIESAAVLTVIDDETGDLVTRHLAKRIKGKTIVDVGGGIGLLALHLSHLAKHVYVIEANPFWMSAFVKVFYEHKPANVTYIFGAGQEMIGQLRADVAVFCTHSAHDAMHSLAASFAPQVIDVYGEIAKSIIVTDFETHGRGGIQTLAEREAEAGKEDAK